MISSQAIDVSLDQLYAETAGNFEQDLSLFLHTAASLGGEADERRKQHLLTAFYAIAYAFEALMTVGRLGPGQGKLVCPLSASGLEFYRQRFRLSDAQWGRAQAFFDSLRATVGGDLAEHVRRELDLPCRDCQAQHPVRLTSAA